MPCRGLRARYCHSNVTVSPKVKSKKSIACSRCFFPVQKRTFHLVAFPRRLQISFPIHHPKGFFESKDRVVFFEKYAQKISTLSSLLSKICRVIGSRQADKPKTKLQFHRLAFPILPRQTARTSEHEFPLTLYKITQSNPPSPQP